MPRRQRDEERDWRATLFVWRGVLDVSRSGAGLPCVTWGGVWVPTDTDTLPDSGDKRYEDSQNEFTLRSRNYVEQDAIEILESCVEPADMENLGELFWGLEHLGDIRLTGSYQLDQGDGRGHHAYTDDWHDMMVSCRGQYAVVAACGDTQFGRFVSLGYVDGQEVYLGYDPDLDLFVMGFDVWPEDADVMEGLAIELMPDGTPMEIISSYPGGMYPHGLRGIKKEFPGIIDLRLD